MLAILTPYTYDRQRLLDRLAAELYAQKDDANFVFLTDVDQGHSAGGRTTGAKRNDLIKQAVEIGCTHAAFVDSDDLISSNYIKIQNQAVEGDYDCAELWGQYWENGHMLNPFHHSIKHDHWWQDKKFYYRCPNHLNCMKLSLIKDIPFRDIVVGEDGNWSMDIQKAGVLKREYPVKQILYYYFAGGRKDHTKELQMALKRGVNI